MQAVIEVELAELVRKWCIAGLPFKVNRIFVQENLEFCTLS
jgi:hypothetical protein